MNYGSPRGAPSLRASPHTGWVSGARHKGTTRTHGIWEHTRFGSVMAMLRVLGFTLQLPLSLSFSPSLLPSLIFLFSLFSLTFTPPFSLSVYLFYLDYSPLFSSFPPIPFLPLLVSLFSLFLPMSVNLYFLHASQYN